MFPRKGPTAILSRLLDHIRLGRRLIEPTKDSFALSDHSQCVYYNFQETTSALLAATPGIDDFILPWPAALFRYPPG
jgi:hypothetical protein